MSKVLKKVRFPSPYEHLNDCDADEKTLLNDSRRPRRQSHSPPALLIHFIAICIYAAITVILVGSIRYKMAGDGLIECKNNNNSAPKLFAN